MSKATIAAGIFFLSMFALVTQSNAQLERMGPPLPTTLILAKPGPDETFGNKQVVTLGVGRDQYKFLLKDAYVSDPAQRVHFPDVWEYVQQFRPNFVVQGMDSDAFAKIQPGQTMTINAMFAPMDRTLEVISSELGKPSFAQPQPKSY